MQIPYIRKPYRGLTSQISSTTSFQIKKNYTSPIIEQYEKIAAKYKKYINDFSPKIDTICEKENYRSYLAEQKLKMIKSHLTVKKEELQKELEEKIDPIKSSNGKLHCQIISLTNLESNYKQFLNTIETNIKDKKKEIQQIQQIVNEQHETIKSLLKFDFQQSQQKKQRKLPKLQRQPSQSSVMSQESNSSSYRRSREIVMSKLGEDILQRTNKKLNYEQQKLIMLKLFVVYYHSQLEKSEGQQKLIDAIEKQILVRQDALKDIRKEIGLMEPEKKVSRFA